MRMGDGFSRETETKKRPPRGDERFHISKPGWRRLTARGCLGNATNVGAIDAEIVQFAVAHAAELGDCLTVLAPIVEGACYVHDGSPFVGFQSSAASPWRFVCFAEIYVAISDLNVQR